MDAIFELFAILLKNELVRHSELLNLMFTKFRLSRSLRSMATRKHLFFSLSQSKSRSLTHPTMWLPWRFFNNALIDDFFTIWKHTSSPGAVLSWWEARTHSWCATNNGLFTGRSGGMVGLLLLIAVTWCVKAFAELRGNRPFRSELDRGESRN